MKKVLFSLWAAALALVACNTVELSAPVEEQEAFNVRDITLNLSVGGFGPETKAVKTGWEFGDRIYIWHSNCDNTDSRADIVIMYDGNSWQIDPGVQVSGRNFAASGTLRAVYESTNDLYQHDITVGENLISYQFKPLIENRPRAAPLVVYEEGSEYTFEGGVLTAKLGGWKFLNNVQLVISNIEAFPENLYIDIIGDGYINNGFGINTGSSSSDFFVPCITSKMGASLYTGPDSAGKYSLAFMMNAVDGKIGKIVLHDYDEHMCSFEMPELSSEGFYAAKVNRSKFDVQLTTCADFLADTGIPNCFVGGICTKITNTNYGNWYINDGTGEFLIYGTVNDEEKYAWSDFGINVGDYVIVDGWKSNDTSGSEIKRARFVTKIAPPTVSPSTVPSEGGDIVVTCPSGCAVTSVDISESYQSWLSIKSQTETQITFTVAANQGVDRMSNIIVHVKYPGYSGVQFPVAISQTGSGSGSPEYPCSVEDAIAICNKSGGIPDQDFYVKGIVTKVVEFNSLYGNVTFWISDDGVGYVSEDGKSSSNYSHDFEVYRAKWLENEDWTESDPKVAVGDEVIICGKLTKYYSTCETQQNQAYVYSYKKPTT